MGSERISPRQKNISRLLQERNQVCRDKLKNRNPKPRKK